MMLRSEDQRLGKELAFGMVINVSYFYRNNLRYFLFIKALANLNDVKQTLRAFNWKYIYLFILEHFG